MKKTLYIKHLLSAFLLCVFLFSAVSLEISAQTLPGNVKMSAGHPRLLMKSGDEAFIKASIGKDAFWKQNDSLLMRAAGEILPMPESHYVVIGRRLLDVSRETLRRVLLLGYAFRITGDTCYSNRAEKELLAVCRFKDWNPSHYLDVAEMTTAVAIGYDWFYSVLSPNVRAQLRKAIISKGLRPSFDSRYNNWLDRVNNWNQVCNTGMAYGALAIYEEAPALADSIISRSIKSVIKPMKNYAPDGAYPEGYSYWGFGTTYNVMLIDALEKCFGTDFGLSQQKGFLPTAGFVLHMVAPDLDSFNYGDNKDSGRMSPAMFWLAKRNNDLSLLWNERKLFEHGNKHKLMDYRFFTLALLWGAGMDMSALPQPQKKTWFSPASVTPVALMRTSWKGKKGIFLAFKGGSASASHAHLDAGSFVLVADGERWAMDFGRQDYHSLESRGMDIWNKTQNSDRWKVFRYTNQAHNTLTFNGQNQRVDGYVSIAETSDNPDFSYAIADLTPVYAGQIKEAKRGVALVSKRYVVVRDELQTGAKATRVRWTMLTPADVKLVGKNKIELRQKDKRLTLWVESPAKITLKTWSTKPVTDYDAENPGTVLVGFEAQLPANSRQVLQVRLVPGDKSVAETQIQSLNRWKTKR